MSTALWALSPADSALPPTPRSRPTTAGLQRRNGVVYTGFRAQTRRIAHRNAGLRWQLAGCDQCGYYASSRRSDLVQLHHHLCQCRSGRDSHATGNCRKQRQQILRQHGSFAGSEFVSSGLMNGETVGGVSLVSAGAHPLPMSPPMHYGRATRPAAASRRQLHHQLCRWRTGGHSCSAEHSGERRNPHLWCYRPAFSATYTTSRMAIRPLR